MIVLRRMAYPIRFSDLVNIFGLPAHRICEIFHSTIDFLYLTYAQKLNRFEIWKDHFPAFAQEFKRFGAPYDNMINIIDGHNIISSGIRVLQTTSNLAGVITARLQLLLAVCSCSWGGSDACDLPAEMLDMTKRFRLRGFGLGKPRGPNWWL